MIEIRYTFLLLKEYFRKHPKTTWGKIELAKELDELEERITKEVKE